MPLGIIGYLAHLLKYEILVFGFLKFQYIRMSNFLFLQTKRNDKKDSRDTVSFLWMFKTKSVNPFILLFSVSEANVQLYHQKIRFEKEAKTFGWCQPSSTSKPWNIVQKLVENLMIMFCFKNNIFIVEISNGLTFGKSCKLLVWPNVLIILVTVVEMPLHISNFLK